MGMREEFCEYCDKKIRFSDSANKVRCPNCSNIFCPKPLHPPSREWEPFGISLKSFILWGTLITKRNLMVMCGKCNKKILCSIEATKVLCQNCNNICYPIPLERPSSRGWKIAGVGLPLSLSLFLLLPLSLLMNIGIEFDIDGYDLFLMTIFLTFIGTPIALIGLLLSITDKLNIGNKFITIEIFLLIMVCTNAYFVMTISGASP